MSESDTDGEQPPSSTNARLTQDHNDDSKEQKPLPSGTRERRVLRKMYRCKLCQAQFSTVENYKRHLSKKVSCSPESDLQIFKKLIDAFIEALRQFDSTESNNDKTSMIKLGRQMARLYKVLSDEEKEEIDDDYHDGVLAVLEDLTA